MPEIDPATKAFVLEQNQRLDDSARSIREEIKTLQNDQRRLDSYFKIAIGVALIAGIGGGFLGNAFVQAKKELESLTDKLDEQKTELQSLTLRLEEQKGELDSQRNATTELETSIEEASTRSTEISNQLSDTEARVSAIAAERSAFEEKVAEAVEQVEALNSRCLEEIDTQARLTKQDAMEALSSERDKATGAISKAEDGAVQRAVDSAKKRLDAEVSSSIERVRDGARSIQEKLLKDIQVGSVIDDLRVRNLKVLDEKGQNKILLIGTSLGPQIRFVNQSGKTMITIGALGDLPLLSLSSETGTFVVNVTDKVHVNGNGKTWH